MSLECVGAMRGTLAGEGTVLGPLQSHDSRAEFLDNPGQIYGQAEGTCPPSSPEGEQPWQPKPRDIN